MPRTFAHAPGFRLPTPAGVLLVLTVLALGAGCQPRYRFGPEAYEDPGSLLDAVQATLARPDTLEGQARLRLTGPSGRMGADHFVAIRRPADLRFETLGFFGDPMALLLVRDGRLLLWNLHEGQAWVGPATAETLGLVVPVRLGPDDVAELLLATPRPLPTDDVRLVRDAEAGLYRVLLGGGDLRQEWDVDPGELTVREVRWYEGGRETGRLTYGRWRRAGRGLFPFEMRYASGGGASIEISWREVSLDVPLSERRFDVALPPEVPVRQVGGGAEPAPWLPPEPGPGSEEE